LAEIKKDSMFAEIINQKKIKMKKLIAIVAVAMAFTACNNAADTATSAAADSAKAAITADSIMKAKAADTTNKMAPKIDSALKTVVDSAKGAVKEGAEKMKEGAEKMKEGAADKMKEGGDKMKEGAEKMKAGVKEAIKH